MLLGGKYESCRRVWQPRRQNIIVKMSKVYNETGRELYIGAGNREHD